ncbi:GNAT family N-acetyltransferase [Salinadaptatus halalkaliphilus]|uniref:GNAT family N-acetyltransferase n=1 Tax=Salinadaptatus halalkaliphilus TaxID=2419781 RepID=A0A4S3TJE3_9EURY|nr:GNAT family N-acetyltransferase [Salinadaptatus halalkaliphilus]THE62708.1 GNAT family N-acetyltransferase [Salinadaptatus halalkaliphilus]
MVEIRVADDADDRDDAFAVRRTVFVDEQGVDEDLEYDDHEDEAVHFVAYDGAEPIGAARLREYEDGVGKAERVAVVPSRRENGIGRNLMTAVEMEAATLGFETLLLHAQTRVTDFYESLEYEQFGEEFKEAGIPHVKMRKSLE